MFSPSHPSLLSFTYRHQNSRILIIWRCTWISTFWVNSSKTLRFQMLKTFLLHWIWGIKLHCDSKKRWSFVHIRIPTGIHPFKTVYYSVYVIWLTPKEPDVFISTALVTWSTTSEEHCAVRELGICSSWQATREMSSKAAAQQQRPQVSRENVNTHFCAPELEINTNQSTPGDKAAAERSSVPTSEWRIK